MNPSSSSSSSTVRWISQSGVNVTARNLRFQKRRQRDISPFPLKTPRNKTWLLWHVCAFKSAVRQSPRSSHPGPPQPHRLLALIPAKEEEEEKEAFQKNCTLECYYTCSPIRTLAAAKGLKGGRGGETTTAIRGRSSPLHVTWISGHVRLS